MRSKHVGIAVLGLASALQMPSVAFATEDARSEPQVSARSSRLDELVRGISWEMATGLLVGGMTAVAAYGLGKIVERRREVREKARVLSGDRLQDDARIHRHCLYSLPDGSKVLLFRTIPPADSWEKVLGSSVIADHLRKAAAASDRDGDNPSVPLGQEFFPKIYGALASAITREAQSVPGHQPEFLLFLTCEDSQNKNRKFETAIRGFLITEADLTHFADLDRVKSTRVEQEHYGYRLIALHKLASAVQEGSLLEGQHFIRITIPARNDDKPTSTHVLVDWESL